MEEDCGPRAPSDPGIACGWSVLILLARPVPLTSRMPSERRAQPDGGVCRVVVPPLLGRGWGGPQGSDISLQPADGGHPALPNGFASEPLPQSPGRPQGTQAGEAGPGPASRPHLLSLMGVGDSGCRGSLKHTALPAGLAPKAGDPASSCTSPRRAGHVRPLAHPPLRVTFRPLCPSEVPTLCRHRHRCFLKVPCFFLCLSRAHFPRGGARGLFLSAEPDLGSPSSGRAGLSRLGLPAECGPLIPRTALGTGQGLRNSC